MKTIEVSPSFVSHLVIIGRNAHGQWVAQEQHGLFGGVFVNRAQAIKYALSENGDHAATIVLTTIVIELNLGTRASASPLTIEANDSSYRSCAA